MNNIISQAKNDLQNLAERKLILYWLSHQDNLILHSIQKSIHEVLRNKLTTEEKKWINRIENIRTQMNASIEEITRIDFGAGNPSLKLSQEVMQSGIEVIETLGYICQKTSKPKFWCLLLFKLIRNIRPISCIELGTSIGISASYQASALQLNSCGSLATLEGSSSLAHIADNNFMKLGLDNVEIIVGRFQDTLFDVLENRGAVDFVFIDGHHDEQATLKYFQKIIPFLEYQALLIFDDIKWSSGMKRAWNAIAEDDCVSLALDLGPVGLCVIDNSINQYKYFSFPLP